MVRKLDPVNRMFTCWVSGSLINIAGLRDDKTTRLTYRTPVGCRHVKTPRHYTCTLSPAAVVHCSLPRQRFLQCLRITYQHVNSHTEQCTGYSIPPNIFGTKAKWFRKVWFVLVSCTLRTIGQWTQNGHIYHSIYHREIIAWHTISSYLPPGNNFISFHKPPEK